MTVDTSLDVRSDFKQVIEDYLKYKRALGYKADGRYQSIIRP